MIKPIIANDYTIKDLFYFAEDFLYYYLITVMASFEGEALFTFTFLSKTLIFVLVSYYKKNCIVGLTKEHFHELLIINLFESLVLLDGKYF